MADHRSPPVRAFLLAVAVISSAAALQGQIISQASATPPGSLELRSSSEAAKSLFREALYEAQNVGGPTRIRRAIDSAVKLDPQFALAGVYKAFAAAGTPEARAKAIADLLPGMSAAPAAELLLAIYWRESAAGRAAAAAPILKTVAELVPADADVALAHNNAQAVGKPVPEQIRIRKEFIHRFPAVAAPHNTIAYQLALTDLDAAVVEVREYVRLAPNHPNSHDSYADMLLLQRRPAEALPHVKRTIELDTEFAQGPMKLGVINLMLGNAAAARSDFARGQESFEAPATKREFMYWTAASYAHTGDGKSALRELSKIPTTELNPAQTSVLHERIAGIEAYLGDRKAVPGHLTAAGAGTPLAAHFAIKAIISARINDLEQARAAAAQFKSMVPSTNTFPHTLNALIAMRAKDLPSAERELAAVTQSDLFTKAVRADLHVLKGQKPEAEALRQEILASSLKLDGNPSVDFFKIMARMHVNKL